MGRASVHTGWAGVLIGFLSIHRAWSQEGTVDLLGGETLYEGGWLFSCGFDLTYKGQLQSGANSVADPLNRTEIDQSLVVSAMFGARNDLQVGILIPFVWRQLTMENPPGPGRIAAGGLGDMSGVIKWRFYRWDEPHSSLNCSAMVGVKAPTGSTEETDNGVRVDPALQPGTGSWDPFLGAGATFEPYRWRFNAFTIYIRHSDGAHGYKFGDEILSEIAVGNRFWLEPYPGPFMRLDFLIHWRHLEPDSASGVLVSNSGEDLLTLGMNLVFRPRPSLDLQLSVEYPVFRYLGGAQLAESFSVFLIFGYRI